MQPLKDLLDQFVSEGMLIQDNNCDFTFHWKDEGIRMAVDYREVNMQLETTSNQSTNFFINPLYSNV